MLISSPILKLPSDVVDVTEEMVGAVLSITIALFALKEFAAPGLGKVRSALVELELRMVPLFSASAEVLL